jgi:hypothetical protein
VCGKPRQRLWLSVRRGVRRQRVGAFDVAANAGAARTGAVIVGGRPGAHLRGVQAVSCRSLEIDPRAQRRGGGRAG